MNEQAIPAHHVCETFKIIHKEHGEAVCDERMWPEFEKAGWRSPDKEKAAAEAAKAKKADKETGDKK